MIPCPGLEVEKPNGVRGELSILIVTLRSARSGIVHELEERETLINGFQRLARTRSQEMAPSFELYMLHQSTTVGKEIDLVLSEFDDLQV